MRKRLLFYVFILITGISSAQLYEGGVFLGGSNYIGDIGSEFYIQPNRIAVGGIAKFNYTPRITFRATGIYTRLHDSDSRAQSKVRQSRGLQFKNSILEASLGVEFSFFKYSLSKTGFTQTPYIIAQVGAVNYASIGSDGASKRTTSVVFPVGLGYKMKLMDNVGIALESSFRYTFKDVIDGNNHAITGDPNRTFGNPNSKDWYVFTGITIVYAFGRPGCYTGAF
ncbi:type IX secretion system protein PorG [Aureibaculum conchae]|uniref:type IX secretion system protein PorG n=1 Tax=Aureibaculum sp. 2308TA14-22 TaxID=3108392 RepID=UPI003396082D